MQKFILPAFLAAAVSLLPSHARAGGISITVAPAGYRGGYGYAPQGYAAPAYLGYGQGYYDYTPSYPYTPSYNYAPSVYYNYTPNYQPYGGYYYPQYRDEWRGRDRHEWREHEEREEHEEHERHEHRR